MGDLLEQIPFLRAAWRCLKWVWQKMMPAPVFLCVTQGTDFRTHPHTSWLHLMVRVRPGLFWWKGEIPNCEPRIFRQWGNSTGEGITMRWHSSSEDNGVPAQTLVVDRTYAIPVAWRDENGDGTAFITNQNWLTSGGNDRKWPLVPRSEPSINRPGGQYEFELEIRGVRQIWRSKRQRYVLRVPPEGTSNAFFTLEAIYP